jgi:selenocysteine lyase/cysteine desulfurase
MKFESYRKEFPVTENYIYLDHAGVSPLSLRVKGAVEAYLSEAVQGGAFHYPRWAARIAEVRRTAARLINAEPDEVAFVKSTSHGLSIAAEGLDWKPGENLLIYEKEFPSNIYPWLNLGRKGVEIRTIPSREGRIEFQDIEKLMDARTRLLSVSSVQFSNGFRIDLKKLGDLCKSRGVLLCVDAIQSLGVVPMDVKDYNIDFLSADAHKWLLGPEGVGIFYCKKGLADRISPPLVGWKSVQNEFLFDNPEFRLKTNALRFEEGSMNLMGIFGLGAAVDLLFEAGIQRIQEQVLDLGDLILDNARARGHCIISPGNRDERGGNVTFTGYFNPVAVRDALAKQGVMINVRGGGLRISPHFYNTTSDIERFFSIFDNVVSAQSKSF